MRLKPTTAWLALTALVLVVVFLVRSRRETGPIVSGRPMSHWIDVVEGGPGPWTATGGFRTYHSTPEYKQALKVLQEVSDKAVLQSLILDRIEAAYSPSARSWHQVYFSIPPELRRHLARPSFGKIQYQTVVLLDGILPTPSARQRSAIQTMLRFGPINEAEGAAQLVALSTATQTIPESIAGLRQQLGVNKCILPYSACMAIRAKSRFVDWRNHPEAVSGLLADLKQLSVSAPNSYSRDVARQTLDKLTFKLGASETATTNRDAKPESALANAGNYTDLALESPLEALERNRQLAPSTPTPGADPFKP